MPGPHAKKNIIIGVVVIIIMLTIAGLCFFGAYYTADNDQMAMALFLSIIGIASTCVAIYFGTNLYTDIKNYSVEN